MKPAFSGIICSICLSIIYTKDWEDSFRFALKADAHDALVHQMTASIIYHSISLPSGHLRHLIQQALSGDESTCLACMGCVTLHRVLSISDEIIARLDALNVDNLDVCLDVMMPPVIEAVRTAARVILAADEERLLSRPNPRFETVLHRALAIMLKAKRDIDLNPNADLHIKVEVDVPNQFTLCTHIFPKFAPKKQKRVLDHTINQVMEHATADCSVALTQGNVDKVMTSLKSVSRNEITAIETRLRAYITNHSDTNKLTINVNIDFGTVYLFGRYNKYARDVPQTPWMSNSNNDEEDDGADLQHRIGRASVEEIIAYTVREQLQCQTVQMHGCGREDIDVRCLGNGRPFVLQLKNVQQPVTSETLEMIQNLINSKQGLNSHQDILISSLQRTVASTWERMQVEAEEKRKGYCCVVYSERKLTKEDMHLVEQSCRNELCLDDEGRVGLQIVQRTPMRVMHRRAMLDRIRFIYDIENTLLNDHYFILKLVTSAGTYVKEFVHGDFGRTIPSISSMLNTRAEILQLDVVWLYDNFEAIFEEQKNNPPPEVDATSNMQPTKRRK